MSEATNVIPFPRSRVRVASREMLERLYPSLADETARKETAEVPKVECPHCGSRSRAYWSCCGWPIAWPVA